MGRELEVEGAVCAGAPLHSLVVVVQLVCVERQRFVVTDVFVEDLFCKNKMSYL